MDGWKGGLMGWICEGMDDQLIKLVKWMGVMV